jgi:hypothetical protein
VFNTALGETQGYQTIQDPYYKQAVLNYETALNRFDCAKTEKEIESSILEVTAAEIRVAEEYERVKQHGPYTPPVIKKQGFFDLLFDSIFC